MNLEYQLKFLKIFLEFPAEDEAVPVAEKKVVDYLFIEADEVHASLQFNGKKGDLKKSESGRKLNGIITKLVYVHEPHPAEEIHFYGSASENEMEVP